MNITKLTATIEDGSEVVLFPAPVVEPTPATEIQKITIPLNTPVELITA